MFNQFIHCHLGHFKSLREGLESKPSGSPKVSGLNNLFFGELVRSNLFTSKLATFLNFVLHILGAITKPKVIWIYTSRIVPRWAIMKNAHPLWDWTNFQNPRCARSNHHLSVSRIDVSISTVVSACQPKPASPTPVHLGPEPLWKAFGKTLRSQILGRNFNTHWLVCADWVTGPSALSLLCQPL